MTELAMIRQPETNSQNNDRFPQIYEIISRQRYATEQLLKYLKAKRAAFADSNFILADRLQSGIARLSETIVLSMNEIQRLLDGQSLETFTEALPEHMCLPLASAAEKISRLEWLCLKELSGINALLQQPASAPVKLGASSRHQSLTITQANG